MSCACSPNLGYTLADAIQGNTWVGISQLDFSSDGTTFDDAIASVKFTAVDSEGAEVLALTDGSGITIVDADLWQIVVDPITPLTIDAGTYSYALEITDDGGTIRTWLAGTWKITADAVT